MITVLAITLVAAGVLLIIVAARMWSGKYYEANRRLATVMPGGVAPWTMPVPMAGFGITFIGIGAVMLLPRELTSIGVGVLMRPSLPHSAAACASGHEARGSR